MLGQSSLTVLSKRTQKYTKRHKIIIFSHVLVLSIAYPGKSSYELTYSAFKLWTVVFEKIHIKMRLHFYVSHIIKKTQHQKSKESQKKYQVFVFNDKCLF